MTYFVSERIKMLVLLSSAVVLMTGCGGQSGNNDQNSSMLSAQSNAIVANEAHSTMSKALKNFTIVKASDSGIAQTAPASSSTVSSTPAS